MQYVVGLILVLAAVFLLGGFDGLAGSGELKPYKWGGIQVMFPSATFQQGLRIASKNAQTVGYGRKVQQLDTHKQLDPQDKFVTLLFDFDGFYFEESRFFQSIGEYRVLNQRIDNPGKLHQATKELTSYYHGGIVSTRQLALANRYPGQEVKIACKDERVGLFRYYLVGRELWILYAIGQKDFVESERTKTFLESFKLL